MTFVIWHCYLNLNHAKISSAFYDLDKKELKIIAKKFNNNFLGKNPIGLNFSARDDKKSIDTCLDGNIVTNQESVIYTKNQCDITTEYQASLSYSVVNTKFCPEKKAIQFN